MEQQAWVNNLDPSQALQNVASGQGLHCFVIFNNQQ